MNRLGTPTDTELEAYPYRVDFPLLNLDSDDLKTAREWCDDLIDETGKVYECRHESYADGFVYRVVFAFYFKVKADAALFRLRFG